MACGIKVEQSNRHHEARGEGEQRVEPALAPARPRGHRGGTQNVGCAGENGVAERGEVYVQAGVSERRSAIATVDSDNIGAGA